MPEIRCDIEPPAVDIKGAAYPFPPDLKDRILKRRRAFIIQLRQCIIAPPAIVNLIIGPLALLTEFKVLIIRAIL